VSGDQEPRGQGPTHLPAATAVVLPADDGEGRFARGAEAAGLVRHPLRGVCHNKSRGHISHGGAGRLRLGVGVEAWQVGRCR
jgi:hypothetical protein